MEHQEFRASAHQVGDKVIMADSRGHHNPDAYREVTIVKISPKRGDVTVEWVNTTVDNTTNTRVFDHYGNRRGEPKYSVFYCHLLPLEYGRWCMQQVKEAIALKRKTADLNKRLGAVRDHMNTITIGEAERANQRLAMADELERIAAILRGEEPKPGVFPFPTTETTN